MNPTSEPGLIPLCQSIVRGASDLYDDETFRIRTAFAISMFARPEVTDPLYYDDLVLVCCEGAGYCTSTSAPTAAQLRACVGTDARYLVVENPGLALAVLDAAFASLATLTSVQIEMRGPVEHRGRRRAATIADETELCTERGGHVIMVGAVGRIIRELVSRGFSVTACDLDQSLRGLTIEGAVVKIDDGINVLQSASDPDVILATGMTLVNGSILALSEFARSAKIPLMMYCQSGTSIAPYLMESLGIAVVITEPFPNYFFPGPSTINIYRRGERDA